MHNDVLEVKVHSKHLRVARMRRFSLGFGWVLGGAVLTLLAWHGIRWALDEFVYSNPKFGIRRIVAQTDGILPPKRLRLWTGVEVGDNLFGVDIQRVSRDLKLNSLIREAAVDRVIPDTLWVRVSEREPVVQFTAWQQNLPEAIIRPIRYFLDDEGFLLVPSDLPKLSLELKQLFDGMPRLVGVDLAELGKNRAVESPRILAALKFVAAFDQSPMAPLVDLEEIDLSTPNVLNVTTRQDQQITFGYEDHAAQLQRWRAVQEFAVHADLAIATLDLSVSNNVPARWQEASYVRPFQHQKPQTRPYKKRHV